MKTLILNGSPRENGDTASLLSILTPLLDGDIKIIDCYSTDISPCIDCRACRTQPNCAVKDSMQQVYDYIKICDNVVIASPIYFSQPTGKLLDVGSRFQLYFSQRFFRNEAPDIKPKRGGVILVGGGDGDPQKAYDTAVCLLRSINTAELFPLVCSHNTDRVPAVDDLTAIGDVKRFAAFLNRE